MTQSQTDLSLDALGCVKAARGFMQESDRDGLAAWLGRGRKPVELVQVTLILAGMIAQHTTEDDINEIALDLMAQGFPGTSDIP